MPSFETPPAAAPQDEMGQAEARMARAVLNGLRRIDLSWVRIEIALLVGIVILAG